jgi:hypothetical protein
MAETPEETLASVVAEVQAEEANLESLETPEPEEEIKPLGDNDCMYCRQELIEPRHDELVCDGCLFSRMTVEDRCAWVYHALKVAAGKSAKYNDFLAVLKAETEVAVTLASGRDARLVYQYSRGLTEALEFCVSVEKTPFPIEAYKEYVSKRPQIWGD